MQQQIENIIKKNLPEKQDVSKAVAHSQHKFAILGHNKCLDEINTSLIADEVLKAMKNLIGNLPENCIGNWDNTMMYLLDNLSSNKENK